MSFRSDVTTYVKHRIIHRLELSQFTSALVQSFLSAPPVPRTQPITNSEAHVTLTTPLSCWDLYVAVYDLSNAHSLLSNKKDILDPCNNKSWDVQPRVEIPLLFVVDRRRLGFETV